MATWYTASTAQTDMNIKVTQKGLDAAREQCLRFKGLAIGTPIAPSESFAQGVVMQALANKISAQAAGGGDGDELGGETNRVRVFPMDKKIQSLLIIPAPTAGYIEPATVTWPTGETVTLSRDGDIVTASIDPGDDGTLPSTTMPWPDVHFALNGEASTTVFPGENYALILTDTGTGQQGISFFALGPGPFLPGTARWLADPLPVTPDSRDLGRVDSLIG